MCNVIPKDTALYAKFVLDERDPALIPSPGASYDARNYFSHLEVNRIILEKTPASEGMSYFNRLQRFGPPPVEYVVEDSQSYVRWKCRMGRIQARNESTASN